MSKKPDPAETENVDAPEEDASINIGRCRRLVNLTGEMRLLEKKMKDLGVKIKKLHGPIEDDMVRCGLKTVPFRDGSYLQVRSTMYCTKAKGVVTPQIRAALKKVGWDTVLDEGYSAAKVKERCIEERDTLLADDRGVEIANDPQILLPEELRPLFNVGENTQVVVYGATTKEEKADG